MDKGVSEFLFHHGNCLCRIGRPVRQIVCVRTEEVDHAVLQHPQRPMFGEKATEEAGVALQQRSAVQKPVQHIRLLVSEISLDVGKH